MFWARLRPILVKKLFNVFAISNVFVVSLSFISPLNFVGRGSLVLFLDKMSFNVFHVSYIILEFLKCYLKILCFGCSNASF